MIKELKITNLNNKYSNIYKFKKDINILTGKNGCGKTTLMKLMWYMVSGNIDKIFDELTIDYAKITMYSGSSLEINAFENEEKIKCVKLNVDSKEKDYNISHTVPINGLDAVPKYTTTSGSLFFPTFRRIEGGFTTTSNPNTRQKYRRNILREAFDSISDNLTTSFHHKFIASISTEDINYLLSNKYADISEEIRKLEATQSKNILNIVSNSTEKEKESLEKIRNLVRDNDKNKDDILRPFYILSGLIKQIFKDKSIKISNNLELGEAKEAINSDKLSAGEKQMLSFLCYNFFYDNSVIFIDEPELSLHTDWQRLLFPILLKQKKDNQFIIATHSPFIYSKYPDKEIIIDYDKGEKKDLENNE